MDADRSGRRIHGSRRSPPIPSPSTAGPGPVGAVVPGTFGPQVVRRGAVEYALAHPEEFSSGMEAVDLGQSVPLIPLQVDPPEHRKYRRLLDPIFAPRRMNVLEPDITRLVNERIDGFIDRGECDFAAEFAVPLPSSVFLRLVGPAPVGARHVPRDEGRHPAAVRRRPRRDPGQPEGRPPGGSRSTSPRR